MQPANRVQVHRIGLGAQLLNLSGSYRSAGINWYIYHLLKNLPSTEFDLTVFSGEPSAREHFHPLHIRQTRLPTRYPLARIVWEQFVQPIALHRERIELLHALAFAGPLAISIPWVVTVFDLSFIRYPESFNAANRIYLRWAVGHAVRHADRIIAISESTKRDLVSTFAVSPDRIAVVYCGCDGAFSQPPSRTALRAWRERQGLADPFVLHVGTIEPRKNIIRLVRAFAEAKRRAHLPHKLILVGGRGWKYGLLQQVLEEEQIADQIRFVGYVPQNELPYWYRAADVLAYPSLYEGFGLPPLEAMASALPVVCSNTSSLPEVVGDAALLVDPENQGALTDALIRSATDRTLRQEMSTRGPEQASKFSWARTAHDTAEIYHTVLNERRIGTAHAPE